VLSSRSRRTVGVTLLLASAVCIVAAAAVAMHTAVSPMHGAAIGMLVGGVGLVLAAAGYRFSTPSPSRGARTGRVVLYEYQFGVGISRRSPPVMIRGARDAVERFIPHSEFGVLFQRVAIWREPDQPEPDMPGEAIGVWGRRRCRRLRRILRERGAIVEVRHEPGPVQTIGRWGRSRGPLY
jgi:hypothetical protein